MGKEFPIGVKLKLRDGLTKPLAVASSRAAKSLRSIQTAALAATRYTGKRIATVGRAVGRWGAVGAAAGVYGVARAFTSVDEAVAKLRSIRIAKEEIEKFHKAGIAWSRKNSDSTAEYMLGAYTAISAGLTDTAEAMAAVEHGFNVATATFVDQESAMKLLTGVYNNAREEMGAAAPQMEKFADLLVRTQQTFPLADLSEFGEGFKYVAGKALMAGIPLEQIAIMVGNLNKRMITGSSAGTWFRGALDKLSPASKKLGFDVVYLADGTMDWIQTVDSLRKAYRKLEAEKGPLEAADALTLAFGTNGAGAMTAAMDTVDDMSQELVDFGTGAGVAKDAAGEMTKSTTKRFEILGNRLSNVGAAIGTKLVPQIENMIPVFERWIDGIPGVVGDLGSMVKALDSVGIGFKELGIIAASGVVMGPVAAFAATLAVAAWNWDKLSDKVAAGWGKKTAREGMAERTAAAKRVSKEEMETDVALARYRKARGFAHILPSGKIKPATAEERAEAAWFERGTRGGMSAGAAARAARGHTVAPLAQLDPSVVAQLAAMMSGAVGGEIVVKVEAGPGLTATPGRVRQTGTSDVQVTATTAPASMP